MNQETVVRFLSPASMPHALGYSQVAEVTRGKLILTAGQISADVAGNVVGAGDFAAQVQKTFENLKCALEAAGASFEHVVKLNYYCVESVPAGEIAVVRQIRDRFLNTQAPPASTFVFVSRLVRPEWLIEIEALAVVA
jgi:2-iminobutanoate/2-iminopropanoate deaminase